MRRAFLACLLVLGLTACASAAPASQHQRFTGDLEWGFETSSFRTDDGRGPYWLSAEGDVWPQVVAPIQASSNRPWGRVHLVIEGELSAPGHYGQLGAYERELRVTRVISSALVRSEPQGS